MVNINFSGLKANTRPNESLFKIVLNTRPFHFLSGTY